MAEQTTPVAGNNGASPEVAPPVDQSPAQPEAGKSVSDRAGSQAKGEDLSSHPQFRALQSNYDRKIAQMQQELQAARRAAEQALTKDMTQAEREDYQRSQEYQQFLAERQELEVQRQQLQRQQDIFALSAESGAPVDVLDAAQTYDEAVKIALGWAKKSARQQAEELYKAQQEKREANSVDVGGGAPRTPVDEWQRQYDEAKKAGDSRRLMELAWNAPK